MEVENAFLVGRYPEIVEESGVHFLEADGAVVRFGRVLVGGAYDLSGTHAAPCQETEICLGPVISPAFGINFRGSAKLAPADHADVLVEPPLVQVLDQGAEGLVEHRNVHSPTPEIVAMPVPSTEIE